jgi:hypothetical protein
MTHYEEAPALVFSFLNLLEARCSKRSASQTLMID